MLAFGECKESAVPSFNKEFFSKNFYKAWLQIL